MKRNITLSAVIGAVILMVLLATAAMSTNVHADETPDDDTVTVSGTHTIYITPDKAEIHFGVETRDDTAEAAQKKNTEQVDKAIAKLKEFGIKEKSISTTGFNIYQEYDYEENKPSGYTASTNLTVKDIKIDDAGTIISECVKAGINQVQYISYTCSNYDEEYENALTGAVEAARKKAEVLAKAAGRTLGAVESITEGWQDTSARYTNDYAAASAVTEEAVDAKGVTLMPGDSAIAANVTLTYYLK